MLKNLRQWGMTKKDKASKSGDSTIARNKTARHEFHVEQKFECGIELQGWEIKSIRAGKAQITEAYAIVKKGEIFLFGSLIQPLIQASTHVIADPRRTRKLLLHKNEILTLIGQVERKGMTLIPLSLYWKTNKVKCEIGLAKGKQEHDKRADLKDKEWQRDKQRTMRAKNKFG